MSKHGKRIFLTQEDGCALLKSTLPPPEKRGLIFIDSSFEIKTEYKTIPQAIQAAHKVFATGTYCLWYPVVNQYLHEQLLRKLAPISPKKSLKIEWFLK